jgi:peptidoglycan/xylan/chitin deacetylase (PgdA/CDA1 family)
LDLQACNGLNVYTGHILVDILFRLNYKKNGMAQNLKKLKKIEVIFLFVVMAVFLIVATRYFHSLVSTKNIAKDLNYLKYKAELVFNNLSADNFANASEMEAESIPVLLYHRIVSEPDGKNVTLENFKNQMFSLKKAGYQTVGIKEFYDFIQGNAKLPDKSFLLTFDDGAKNSYFPVDPILKALDYKATMFVITKYSLGQESGISNYYLSREELKEMLQTGRWEIQSHGENAHDVVVINKEKETGHFLSNKLWLDDQQRMETSDEYKKRVLDELTISKKKIEQELETDVIAFAFPFGDYGQTSTNYTEGKDYILSQIKPIYSLASFYQFWPTKSFMYNYPNTAFMVKRIGVDPAWGSDELLDLLERGRSKTLPFVDNFEYDKGWIKQWGDLNINEETMSISANELTSSASIALDGSYLWENYYFETELDWRKGENFVLTSRYKDVNNFVSCDFSEDLVKIEQQLSGENEVLFENKINLNKFDNNLRLGLKIYGNKMACLVNDEIVAITDKISSLFSSGGIGFKIWDRENNNSEIFVKKVHVRDIEESEIDLGQFALNQKQKEVIAKEKAEEAIILEDVAVIDSVDDNFADVLPLPDEVNLSLPYYQNSFASSSPWEINYGEIRQENGNLYFGPSSSSTASMIILSDTQKLSDYKVSVGIDWLRGSSFSLVARYKDKNNYLACSYSKQGRYATLYFVKNGVSKKIGRTPELPVPYFDKWENRRFGMKVIGDKVECLTKEGMVLNYVLPTMPTEGGIGLKSWDKRMQYSNIMVKDVDVSPVFGE